MKSVLIASILAASSVAAADDNHHNNMMDIMYPDKPVEIETPAQLVVNLASHHINAVFGYNENNIGLGYRTNGVEYGFFRNSYHGTVGEYSNGIGYSVYVKGSAYSKTINKYLELNFDFGWAVYGKDGALPFMPIVQPMVIIKPVKDININIGYMPLFAVDTLITEEGTTEESVMYGLITLSASYSF